MKTTPTLNGYKADDAEDVATKEKVLSQIATSEVYFRRPPQQSVNSYGESIGKPVELGSLFNPYWQVRLVNPPSSDLVKAKLLQGSLGY